MERWTDRGAAIVPYGDRIILMRRERGYGKRKKIYYTIPGGGKEQGETIRDTTVREIKEELGIDIEIKDLLMEFETSKRKQYVFIGKYLNGVIGTGDGEEFDGTNNYKLNGGYYPELVSYNQFKKIRLVPLNLKRKILKNFNEILMVQGKDELEKNNQNKSKNITKKVLKGKRKNRHYKKKNNTSDFKKQNNKYVKKNTRNINKDKTKKNNKDVENKKEVFKNKDQKKYKNKTNKINKKNTSNINKTNRNKINKNKN